MEKGTRYCQLSYEERVKIEVLRTQGGGIRSIARTLERSPNTIARELVEKQVRGAYTPKKAQRKTYWRRYLSKRGCLKVALNIELHHLVLGKLTLGWSPERIAGYARRMGVRVSSKAVYKFVRSRSLEHQLFWGRYKKKSGPKRHTSSFRDSSKRGLTLRPELLGSGHTELDFIVSRQSPAVLLVLVDRYTRHTHIRRLTHKTHRGVLDVLKEIHVHCSMKTITTDNDIVFRRWREMETVVSIPFFFTQPYHSWEKGLVENTNRWIRCFVPKRRDVATVTDDELRSIEFFLNETPRQCLGYMMATEALQASLVS